MRPTHPVGKGNPTFHPVATYLNFHGVKITGQFTEAHAAICLCRANCHIDPYGFPYFAMEDTIIGPRINQDVVESWERLPFATDSD